MLDTGSITTQLGLAAAIVSAIAAALTAAIRLNGRAKLKALETDSERAAAIVSDAVVSFKIDTKRISPDQLTDIVRQEIASRDRRHARRMWVALAILAGGVIVVLVLGLGNSKDRPLPDDTGEVIASMIANVDLGRYADAVAQADQVLVRQPDNHRAWYAKGAVSFYTGNYATAVAHFERALKTRPESRTNKMNLADALVEVSAYDRAVATYDSISDAQADAVYGKGRALLYAGKHQQALEALRGLPASFQNGKAKVLAAAARFQIAKARGDAEAIQTARSELREGLQRDPGYWKGVLSGTSPDIHEPHAVTAKLLDGLYQLTTEAP